MFRNISRSKNRRLSLAVLGLVVFALNGGVTRAQEKKPRPSPPAQASVTLSGKSVTIDYGAPSMRGRKVIGGLVPYDKVWRTGANEATTLKTEASLRIGDLVVPAGTYTLYSLPTAAGWKLIINKQTGQWGTVYNEGQDLGRVAMQEGTIPAAPVELFEIRFEHTKANKTELHLIWETTNVFVPITATN